MPYTQDETLATIISNYFDGSISEVDIDTLTDIITAKGYRKASDVVEKVFERLEEKGFLNIEAWAIQEVKDELKKKYTEEV